MDIVNVLNHVGSGGSPLWVGVMGRVPADWEGSGRISPSGDTTTDGEDAISEWGRNLDISSPVGGDGGGGNE